jgi:hypothetical protein
MFTAHARSAAEAPVGVKRAPAGAPLFIIPYPCVGEHFDGHLLPEDRIAALHVAAGPYQNFTSVDASRLRALPRLPPPPAFTPRSHRYTGRPTFDYEGPRQPRRLGAFHRAPKHREVSP